MYQERTWTKGSFASFAATNSVATNSPLGSGHCGASSWILSGAIAGLLAISVSTSRAAEPVTQAQAQGDSASGIVGTLPKLRVQGDESSDLYVTSDATTATRSDAPVLETPVSLQAVTQQTLVDQSAIRLVDALRNVSGVAPTFTSGNVSAVEAAFIRGFDVGNTYWNGFRLRGSSPSVLANVHQIEVIKGPASVLYGRQEPGGIINLSTELPLATPRNLVEQRVGSFDYYETLLDIGAPLNDEGSVRYRLNASYQNAGSFRDFVDSERLFVAPALTWMITPQTELTVEGSYMRNDFLWDNGLVFSPAGYDPQFSAVLPSDRFLQEPNYRSEREEIFVSYRLTHEIREDWTLRHLFLYHRNEFDLNAYRHFGVVDTTGPGDLTVARWYDGTVPTATEFNAIFDTTYKFKLGDTRHELLAGVDVSFEPEAGNTQNGLRGLPNIQWIDAFNPVYGAVPPSFIDTRYSQESRLIGIYLQDQISLADERLHVLLGGRFDYVDQESASSTVPNPPTAFDRDDSAFTFRAGVLYEAADWLHPYVSYAQGFMPPSVYTISPVDPETSEQFEVGVKMPLLEDQLVATVSAYQLTKDNVVGDSDGDGISENFGELRSRGIEFDLTGRIYEGLSAILTYAYTDTEVIESDWLPIGNRFVGVPYHMGSAWLKYEGAPGSVMQGVSFGAGAFGVGSRPADEAESFKVEGYWRWDAFIRYRLSLPEDRALGIQLNVQNLTDEDYVEAVYFTSYAPSTPRVFLASLNFEF